MVFWQKLFVFSFVCRPCEKLNPSTTGTNVFVFLKKIKIKHYREVSFIIPYCKETISLFSEADDDTDIDSVSLSVHNTSHSCHTVNKQMYLLIFSCQKWQQKHNTRPNGTSEQRYCLLHTYQSDTWLERSKAWGCSINETKLPRTFIARNCNKLSSQQH